MTKTNQKKKTLGGAHKHKCRGYINDVKVVRVDGDKDKDKDKDKDTCRGTETQIMGRIHQRCKSIQRRRRAGWDVGFFDTLIVWAGGELSRGFID